MKTVTEWFNTLPEPYRSQAFANVVHQNREHELGDYVPRLIDAVTMMFRWEISNEGHNYWSNFLKTIV